MANRWFTLGLAFIVVSLLILFGLYHSSVPDPGSATSLQQAHTNPLLGVAARSATDRTVYLPYTIVDPPQPTPTPLPPATPLPPTPPPTDPQSLVHNGGFEGGKWHQTHTGEVFDNIVVPEHWVAFWDVGRRRPEMHVIHSGAPYDNPPRVYSGNHALQYFFFWETGDAGVYQRVPVEPGHVYRARAYAHAWYSDLDDPHKSQWLDGSVIRDIVDGDPGMEVMIGIDPYGNSNPWAPTVIWSKANIYDQFKSLEVQAYAQASTITVYLRAETLFPFKHGDAYWDHVTLDRMNW